MRKRMVLMGLLALGACDDDRVRESHGFGLPSSLVTPNDVLDEDASICTVESVTIVTDMDQISLGFDQAPSELLDGLTGVFAGSVAAVFGPAVGELLVDETLGEVRAVDLGENCDSYYELTFVAKLTVGGTVLDERFSATLQVSSVDAPRFVVVIPLEDVRGSLRPKSLLSEVEPTELRIDGRYQEGGWDGSVLWQHVGNTEPVGAFWFDGVY